LCAWLYSCLNQYFFDHRARHRLDVEIVRRLPPALIDEIDREVEVLLLAEQAVELDQRQLDLLVTAIAVLLAGTRTEHGRDVVDVAEHDVEEFSPSGRLVIGDGAFEHVAGAIELVVVAQVRPALVRPAAEIPAVQVAVRAWAFEIVDDGVDLRLDLGPAVAERIAHASIHLPTPESQNTRSTCCGS
jgi:hypothetical protein